MDLGGGIFFETFLEGSVDHITYRDYIVNRRGLISCSLAISPLSEPAVTMMLCYTSCRSETGRRHWYSQTLQPDSVC